MNWPSTHRKTDREHNSTVYTSKYHTLICSFITISTIIKLLIYLYIVIYTDINTHSTTLSTTVNLLLTDTIIEFINSMRSLPTILPFVLQCLEQFHH